MNLIPPEYKKELVYEAWRKYTLAVGFYAASVLVIASTLLLPSFFFLNLQIDNLKKNLDSIQKSGDYLEVATKQKEVERINKSLSAFVSFDKSAPQVSLLLDDLFTHTQSSEITLTSVTYNRTGLSFALAGRATTRDALLSFTEELSKSPLVKDATPPITSFIEKENIIFSITVTLK